MDIWEKLARCETPGELQRMCKGTNWELVEKGKIEQLRKVLNEVAAAVHQEHLQCRVNGLPGEDRLKRLDHFVTGRWREFSLCDAGKKDG